MTQANENANAREEMAKGTEALRAAEELLRLGLFNDAVSRAYYAAYHWARALLFTQGLESRSHRGMIQLVGLHFVRTQRLPVEATTLLGQLASQREAGDYTTSLRFNASDAAEIVSQSRAFINLCRPLLPAELPGSNSP
ncbi:MAG: HEPN domain-containing protein [bacterium]